MRRSLILSVLIILALGGCVLTPTPAPPTSPPRPTVIAHVTPTPTTAVPAVKCTPIGGDLASDDAGYSIKPGQAYVANQLILMGSSTDISVAVDAASGKLKTEWKPLGEANLDYLSEYQKQAELGLPWTSYKGVVTRLYDTGTSVEKSLPVLLEELKATEKPVLAEPNYALDFSAPARQWSVEGSPFDVPTGLGGDPAKAQALFWNQWAFTGTFGVASGQKLRPKERTLKATGAGVTIAVFDTSPFTKTQLPQPQIKWADPQPRLCVSHPVPVPATASPGKATMPPNISDHGLFVAGLAYGVAPESDIHLIRVLNSAGLGDVFTLIRAGNLFAQQALETKKTLQGTVINLSLGFADPKGTDLSQQTKDALAELLAKRAPQYKPLYKAGASSVSMEAWIAMLHSLGAVVVASAGNDSHDNVNAPEDPQAPAIFGSPDVIGVAASNQKGTRACYSNRGAIAAPGGDGVTIGAGACGPASNVCSDVSTTPDPANCGEGLISLVLQRDKSDTGYAFWIGTSFAAPLVSGAVALGLSAPSSYSPVTPLNGLKVISGTASQDLGLGIVSVP